MTDLLTAQEAAQLLRYSRVETIYEKAKRGELPAIRLPGSNRLRFRRSDLIGLPVAGKEEHDNRHSQETWSRVLARRLDQR